LVKIKGYKAVQEYLSLFKQATDYQLQAASIKDGADFVALKAAGWMGVHEMIYTMTNLIEVSKEVVKEYNEYQAALESATD
jgi:hypothetical protein